jgi:lysophospholipase L1-like esterase
MPILKKLALSLASLLVFFVLIELALHVGYAVKDEASRPNEASIAKHQPCDGCGMLYEHNPQHPEIGPDGLRRRGKPRPEKDVTERILILGDSVTFGVGVDSSDTFSSLLEAKLGDVEVINAGVNGYTTYNELQYFLEKGTSLNPDLVVVAVCLNDVVNPRLHWSDTGRNALDIPEEAIPNAAYDRWVARPALHSSLARFIHGKLTEIVRTREPPAFLTGKDAITIGVLMDDESPEWHWLRSMLDRLGEAVERQGARFAILVLPLSHQLDEDYPFDPQPIFARFCKGAGTPCLDVLPRFRDYTGTPSSPLTPKVNASHQSKRRRGPLERPRVFLRPLEGRSTLL